MPNQPIDFLFSPYRRQVLAVLFLRPDEQFHVRELERRTGISAGSLHRELKAMSEAGLLTREKRGNQVLYRANEGCTIFGELASIFRKTIGLASIVGDALAGLRNRIDFAFIFGSMASGSQHAESDIDICVLGEIELIDVVKALQSVRENTRREVNPVGMSKSRFIEALETKDRFADRIANEPKIFVIGNEHEFEELAQHRPALDTYD